MMYTIWYTLNMRRWHTQISGPTVRLEDLQETHRPIAFVEAESAPGETLDDIYWSMQAFNWSPNGEARDIIGESGCGHTSMSVGDVIVSEDGRTWEVLNYGFGEITPKEAVFA